MATNNPASGVAVHVNQNEAFSGQKTSADIPYTEGLGSLGRSTIATLVDYVDYMDPKKAQNQETAIRKQVGLYRAITLTINKNDQDFNKTWNAVLKIFEDYKKGAFHESAIFRYMAFITLPEDKRIAFRRLINLIKVSAPVQGRNIAMRQIDMNRTLEIDVTEEGRNRLLNFYQPFMNS